MVAAIQENIPKAPLPSEMVSAAGQALYGPLWTGHLARDLGVSERTARRWAAGSAQPADGVLREVWALVMRRRLHLHQVAALIERGVK